MCASRASASTSSGCAYSRSIRSRTRRSSARSRRCWAAAGVPVTPEIVPRRRSTLLAGGVQPRDAEALAPRELVLGDRRRCLVALRDAQEHDEREDAAEEDVAGAGRAETQAAVLVAVLGHEVADRGAQRSGEDVGEPEGRDGVGLRAEARERDQGDPAA